MLVNLEPVLGFMLMIKSIQKYLYKYMISPMCFSMRIYYNRLGQYEVELEIEI